MELVETNIARQDKEHRPVQPLLVDACMDLSFAADEAPYGPLLAGTLLWTANLL
jgi:hypothetical protein